MEGNVENIKKLDELRGKMLAIPTVDRTLTKDGACADAKVTGDKFAKIEKQVSDMSLSDSGTMSYDPTNSGLDAQNVQSALDELKELADAKFDKTGGMVEGSVDFRHVDNGHGSVGKNHSATADYGTHMMDVAKDGKTAKVSVSALLGLLTYTDVDGNIRDIYHEGNKPFGSYVGNGSTDERVIETGGIGRLAIVYNIYYFSFVTPEGALVINLTEGTFRWIESTKVFFLSNFKLNTNNVAFNENGTEYFYQVI